MPGDDDDGLLTIDEYRPARRSLRVATVTETYPPEVNGVAQTMARVVDGLRQRGHELQLVRPRQKQEAGGLAGEDGRFEEVLTRGMPLPRYPQLRMGLPSQRRLIRLWQLQRPDVVHIVTEGPLGWSALQAAQRLRLPVVSDFRTNFHAYSRHYGAQWLHGPIMAYLRKFHNRCASTLVPTESLRSELAASGFERLHVVSRGVDTKQFDPAHRSAELRARWGADERTTVALCVGRLAPEKNLDLLLDAHRAMRDSVPAVRLVFVGDGPSAAALRRLCPDAVFAGVQRGDALAAHYASADLFMFPSLTETFGNVVPEAMASGLPVLAFDYAAAGQLVRHGANGLLARVDDAPGWIAQAVRAAGELAWLRQLGGAARTSALQMSWDRIVAQVEAQYDAALRPAALPAAVVRVAPLPTP